MVRLQFIFDLKKPIRDSVEEKNLCFFNISHEKKLSKVLQFKQLSINIQESDLALQRLVS